MSRHRTTAVILALLLAGAAAATAQAAVPRLVFPVVAKVMYTDDFGDPRGSGTHQGNDLMTAKKSKVVAVEAGRVSIYNGSSRAGCMLYLYGRSGTTYLYIHLNNDLTMRNDNDGGCRRGVSYARGLRTGQRVRAGQLIGYVGDSGDADGIAPHLHFELHPNGGRAVSPYRWLRAARHHLYARPSPTVDRLTSTVYGRVVYTRLDGDPDVIRVRARRVRISNGWWVRPARGVTIVVSTEATVTRRSASGALTATTLVQAKDGERVAVATTLFAQTLMYARAAPRVHTARAVQLRGT
jgi:Peptidase family M23